jgi:hypothetical protein
MPNGHSGGFLIETATLKGLLRAAPDTAPIGKLAVRSSPRLRLVNATEVLRLVEESPHERLAVEEQDHSFYIIHVRDEPTPVWVSVKSDSPIFAALALQHSRWKLEHPS